MLNICMLIFIREAEGHLLFLFLYYIDHTLMETNSYEDSNIFAMCLLIFSWLVIGIPFQVLNVFIIIKYTWYFMRSVYQCIIYITIWNNAFCQESLWRNKYNGRGHLNFKIYVDWPVIFGCWRSCFDSQKKTKRNLFFFIA